MVESVMVVAVGLMVLIVALAGLWLLAPGLLVRTADWLESDDEPLSRGVLLVLLVWFAVLGGSVGIHAI